MFSKSKKPTVSWTACQLIKKDPIQKRLASQRVREERKRKTVVVIIRMILLTYKYTTNTGYCKPIRLAAAPVRTPRHLLYNSEESRNKQKKLSHSHWSCSQNFFYLFNSFIYSCIYSKRHLQCNIFKRNIHKFCCSDTGNTIKKKMNPAQDVHWNLHIFPPIVFVPPTRLKQKSWTSMSWTD